MNYTVAVYVRGRFIGWKSVVSDTVPDEIHAERYGPDQLGVNHDIELWKIRNQVRATVGAEPVRLVLAEDK